MPLGRLVRLRAETAGYSTAPNPAAILLCTIVFNSASCIPYSLQPTAYRYNAWATFCNLSRAGKSHTLDFTAGDSVLYLGATMQEQRDCASRSPDESVKIAVGDRQQLLQGYESMLYGCLL